jgi:hypothetical protein
MDIERPGASATEGMAMKITCGLLATGALALSACATPTATTPDLPLSAGSAGPGYCEGAPPTDAEAMERWNELCSPGTRG